jgi:spermidine/putrescine-binding protein
MKKRLTTLAATALAAALTIVAVGAVPATATEGCTPGYWKQAHHFDSWPAGYSPTDNFDTVFTNVFMPQYVVNLFDPNITLLQALKLQGDRTGIHQLARTAVATLLNAKKFGDQFSQDIGFLKLVVYYSQNETKSYITYWKDHFDRQNNEAVCTLN